MKISKGKKDTAVRTVIYGQEGVGKTTLASQFWNPVFIDLENGSNQLDVARVDPAPANWLQLLETVQEFIADPMELSTLVIDSIDEAERMCVSYICARDRQTGLESYGYGKGYQYLKEEFSKLLALCDQLISTGVHVVLVGHSLVRKFELPEESGAFDKYELKLEKKDAQMVKEWADMLLFVNFKTIVTTQDNAKKAYGKERVIHTTHSAVWDAKNRFGLPDELPLSFDGLIPAVKIVSRGEEATYEKKIAQIERLLARIGATPEDLQAVCEEKEYTAPGTPFQEYPDSLLDRIIDKWKSLSTMIEKQKGEDNGND